MAELTTSGGGGPARGDPGERGRLDIADRAVERIATLAAADVPGTARVGGGLESALGRQFPKADANVAGGRVRISIEIAVHWPHPLAEVAAHVRETVRERVHDLSGLDVDAVDVTTARIVHPGKTTARRVQ